MSNDAGVKDLWCHVLLQAVVDSQSPGGSRLYPERVVLAARRWLAGENPWTLSAALAAAGLDADFWRERAVPALRERWRSIDRGGVGAQPRVCRARSRQPRAAAARPGA